MTQLLPCLTPGCDNTPLGLSAAGAKALLDADKAAGRRPILRSYCNRCGATSEYTPETVQELMPPDLQDLALAPQEFWGFIMGEIGTVESTQQRAFLGEPVLLKRTQLTADGWQATLLSPSKFAPSLKVADELFGYDNGDFSICTHVALDPGFTSLPMAEQTPRNSEFALFFLPNEPGAQFLTGTLFCANQSCYYPFQLGRSDTVGSHHLSPPATHELSPPGCRGRVTRFKLLWLASAVQLSSPV